MPTEVLIRGRVSRGIPQPDVDGGREGEPVRVGRYNEQYALPLHAKKHHLADEGSYVTSTMLPGATALQHGILAAFDATKAAIVFQNSDSPGKTNAMRCYLDYIRFLVSIAPTSATSGLYASVLDPKDRTPTTLSSGSGGTGPGTPATATAYQSQAFCPNLDEAPNIVGKPFFPLSTAGGLPPAVPAAGPNIRTIVGNGSLRAQIPVVGDEYIIDFGGDVPPQSLVTAAPAGASRIVSVHPPIVVGPGQFWMLHLWFPGNITAGIAFSGIDMGWWER
jgi:hypothetical protein